MRITAGFAFVMKRMNGFLVAVLCMPEKVLDRFLVQTSLVFNHVRQYHLVWLGMGLLLR